MLSRIARVLRSLLPLPAWWIVGGQLDRGAQSMLDVGCGRGGPIEYIRARRNLSAVGADIFLPYLRDHLSGGVYDGLVLCDIRRLPFRPGAFDVVFCGEVLEHLTQAEGLKLLASMEEVARRQVIVTTPVGHCDQHPYDGNEYQAHRSEWTPRALRRLGYRVRGSGLWRMGGLIAKETSPLPGWLRLLANALWMVATPFSYFFPEIGGGMVCVKRLGPRRGAGPAATGDQPKVASGVGRP